MCLEPQQWAPLKRSLEIQLACQFHRKQSAKMFSCHPKTESSLTPKKEASWAYFSSLPGSSLHFLCPRGN